MSQAVGVESKMCRSGVDGTRSQIADPSRDNAAGGSAPVVSIRELVKRFKRDDGSVVPAIDGLSLDVERGEFVVLLGPSGCGKTTLLRAIAGLEEPESGEIDLYGRPVFAPQKSVPPQQRQVGMVFQSYALWPNMTVAGNVAYPLTCRPRKLRMSKAAMREEVERLLSMVGIPELYSQYPGQLSGGQQQRVAVARALASGHGLVLFDEPLSNVDAKVREVLRHELLTMQHELGFSAVYVTHDQSEALELATRIVVLESGKIAQVGTPREIYFEPSNQYVANFVGSMNELPGVVVEEGDRCRFRVSSAIGDVWGVATSATFALGTEVIASWRPETMKLSAHSLAAPPPTTPEVNVWQCRVREVSFSGRHTDVSLLVGDKELRATAASTRDPEELRSSRAASVAADDVRLLPVQTVAHENLSEGLDG